MRGRKSRRYRQGIIRPQVRFGRIRFKRYIVGERGIRDSVRVKADQEYVCVQAVQEHAAAQTVQEHVRVQAIQACAAVKACQECAAVKAAEEHAAVDELQCRAFQAVQEYIVVKTIRGYDFADVIYQYAVGMVRECASIGAVVGDRDRNVLGRGSDGSERADLRII